MNGGIPSNMSKPTKPISGREFGRRILKLRKARGMRQCDLAAAVEVDRADVCNLERGRGPENLTATTIVRYANALGVSPLDLMV